MDRKALTRSPSKHALAGVLGTAIIMSSVLAVAQEAVKPAPREPEGFFGTISRWWNQAADNWHAGISGVRQRFETLGKDAGFAARTTVDNAKSAADAVARLPNARIVFGHEKCKIAPNGAPDCVAATVALCKSKGFENGGSSLDMTTAEVCPAQVYLSGRNAGEGCHTETFVSRAYCQ